jgi:hypothetical protein
MIMNTVNLRAEGWAGLYFSHNLRTLSKANRVEQIQQFITQNGRNREACSEKRRN